MKNGKRIMKVVIKRMIDESPDTSYLGEYSDRAKTEFAIDRAHGLDCASVTPETKHASEMLEHAMQTVGDLHNEVLAQYNGTLANAKLDTERDALDEAYSLLETLSAYVINCDCHARLDSRSYRYFNSGSVDSHNTPEENRKYALQDYERMERLNAGDWYYLGIRAEATCEVYSAMSGDTYPGPVFISGGLWGIESDSDREYLESVERDELADLKAQLFAFGFGKRAISVAFKNVERKDS